MNKENFYAPIASELEAYRKRYADVLTQGQSGSKLDFVKYILRSEGKAVRPVLTLLSASLNGTVNPSTIDTAVVIELTHNASLIHDDVIDEAFTRRDMFSVNALWRSKKTVLIGDYVFSKAITTAVRAGLTHVIESIAIVLEEMSKGELEQIDATLKLDISEERYFRVIKAKTAYLMSCATRLGALSVGVSDEVADNMHSLGEKIGLMFQIKDDILDYTGSNIGKSVGNDLKERKITLPLIYALRKADKRSASRVMSIIRKGGTTAEHIKEVSRFIVDNKGIEAAEYRMKQFHEEALALLEPYAESASKTAMLSLLDFISKRTK